MRLNHPDRMYLFKGFERFWHWSQMLLILGMLTTGFEVHGTYSWLGYARASLLHSTLAWVLIGLWLFAIFWHFTTGEWRQYIPSTERLVAVMRYYSSGIFKGETHPYRVTPERKHNPLQRLAYLGLKLFIHPLIWASGLIYMYYNELQAFGAPLDLSVVASAHVFGAFLILVFLIGHAYLVTLGPKWYSHIKAMITGWEDRHDR